MLPDNPYTYLHRKQNTERLRQALEAGLIKCNRKTGQVFGRSGKELPYRTNPFGYVSVSIRGLDGKTWDFYVHKIVWVSSGKDIPHGYQINHKSRMRNKNSIRNLELRTVEENLALRQYSKKENPF